MKAKIHTEVKYYIECPLCNDTESFSIGHLLGTSISFGPWYCDKCGYAIQGKVSNGEVEIESLDRYKEDSLVLLEFPPNKEPILLIVKGILHSDTPSSDVSVYDEYYYNQHTCPKNYLRDVEMVMIGNVPDPHGLFQYKGTIQRNYC